MAGIGDYKKKTKGNRGYKMGAPTLLKMVSSLKQEETKKGAGWKKALNIGLSALSGGLDAVYGHGKIVIGSDGKAKKEEKKQECKDKDGYVIDCDSPNAIKK